MTHLRRLAPRARRQWLLVASAAFIAGVAVPTSARAYRILDEDNLQLDLQGWAQAGYAIGNAPGEDAVQHAPYLGLARLAAGATHVRWGRAFVQVEALSGTVRLLDAFADVTPVPEVTLRVGRFKAPTSADFLIGAPYTAFVSRSLLVERGFVQRRMLGAEIAGRATVGCATLSLQLGWFQPESAQRDLLPDGEGNFFSARALVETTGGWGFHLAFMELVLADNDAVAPAEPPDAMAVRPVEMNRQLDGAVWLKRDGWTAYVEGVLVLDAQEDDVPFAFYAMVLRSFDLTGTTFALEPGVRYDLARRDGRTLHRATAGLTFYLVGDFLNASLNYELLVDDDRVGNTGYAQLQAGF